MIWKVLNVFFVTVGVISTMSIVSGLLMYWFWSSGMPVGVMMRGGEVGNTKGEMKNFDHPLLSPAQEQTAASLGIDVTQLPTVITSTQRDCSVEALGEARVKEIESGSTPSAIEIIKAKHCFE